MFKITIEDNATPLMTAMANSVGQVLQTLIKETSDALTPFVQQNAPVGRHYNLDGSFQVGGQLRDSLHFVIGQWGSYLSGASQGRFVIQGTKPHPISPRGDNSDIATHNFNPEKPHLTFFWTREGRIATPERVNHPGQKANDFRWKALQQMTDEKVLQELIDRNMSQWVTQNV